MPTTTNNSVPTPEETLTIECYNCMTVISEHDSIEGAGQRYCEECHNDLFTYCDSCEGVYFNEDVNYIQDEDRHICNDCYDNGDYFSCDDCGERYSLDSRWYPENDEESDDDYYRCTRCAERTSPRRRYAPDLDDTKLQDKKKGQIIKSLRKFGVELECLFNKTDAPNKLSEKISKTWGFGDDGSLKRSKDAVGSMELISPIMSGKAGEDEIKLLTKTARDVGYFVNTSCGYHLHLDAQDYKRMPEDDTEEMSENIEAFDTYYTVTDSRGEIYRFRTPDEIPSQLRRLPFETHTVAKPNKMLVNRGNAFYRLRDLLFVYLAFDDVFRGMQPKSRRSNTFCKCTSSAYSIDDVKDLQDYGELERLWYKVDKRRKLEAQIHEAESRKRGKDSTRYVGFNIEPLLRHNSNTVELRYHSPTLNAEKILRWIDIHQTILDSVAKGIDERTINHVLATETHLIRKAKALCRIFKINVETEEYMMSRLHKFNQIKGSGEDEEVEASEIGRPLHGGQERLMYRPNQDMPQRVRGTTIATNYYTRDAYVAYNPLEIPDGFNIVDEVTDTSSLRATQMLDRLARGLQETVRNGEVQIPEPELPSGVELNRTDNNQN